MACFGGISMSGVLLAEVCLMIGATMAVFNTLFSFVVATLILTGLTRAKMGS